MAAVFVFYRLMVKPEWNSTNLSLNFSDSILFATLPVQCPVQSKISLLEISWASWWISSSLSKLLLSSLSSR